MIPGRIGNALARVVGDDPIGVGEVVVFPLGEIVVGLGHHLDSLLFGEGVSWIDASLGADLGHAASQFLLHNPIVIPDSQMGVPIVVHAQPAPIQDLCFTSSFDLLQAFSQKLQVVHITWSRPWGQARCRAQGTKTWITASIDHSLGSGQPLVHIGFGIRGLPLVLDAQIGFVVELVVVHTQGLVVAHQATEIAVDRRAAIRIDAHHRLDTVLHQLLDQVVVGSDIGPVVQEGDPLDAHINRFLDIFVNHLRGLSSGGDPMDPPPVVRWWSRESRQRQGRRDPSRLVRLGDGQISSDAPWQGSSPCPVRRRRRCPGCWQRGRTSLRRWGRGPRRNTAFFHLSVAQSGWRLPQGWSRFLHPILLWQQASHHEEGQARRQRLLQETQLFCTRGSGPEGRHGHHLGVLADRRGQQPSEICTAPGYSALPIRSRSAFPAIASMHRIYSSCHRPTWFPSCSDPPCSDPLCSDPPCSDSYPASSRWTARHGPDILHLATRYVLETLYAAHSHVHTSTHRHIEEPGRGLAIAGF